MNLQGKKALVTGGAKRVGRAIALELAAAGCDVAVHYCRSKSEALGVVSQIQKLGSRAVAVRADLNQPRQWDRIIDGAVGALGGLDVLINNASVFAPDRLSDPGDGLDPSQWETMYRVNALAPAALCHLARPYLQRGEGGVVINLSDISAGRPWRDHAAYGASKAALNATTVSLAKAFAPAIRVNAVAPGIAIFPDNYDVSFRKRLVARVPLKREGTPQEVAKLVRFLCDGGEYITGQVIAIDGGRSLV